MDILNERSNARTLPNLQILRGAGRIVPACRNQGRLPNSRAALALGRTAARVRRANALRTKTNIHGAAASGVHNTACRPRALLTSANRTIRIVLLIWTTCELLEAPPPCHYSTTTCVLKNDVPTPVRIAPLRNAIRDCGNPCILFAPLPLRHAGRTLRISGNRPEAILPNLKLLANNDSRRGRLLWSRLTLMPTRRRTAEGISRRYALGARSLRQSTRTNKGQ